MQLISKYHPQFFFLEYIDSKQQQKFTLGERRDLSRQTRSAPTFTPLSLRKGVLEGGIGVLFPEGLKTLGAEVLLNGACFGIPLRGA